MEKSSLHLVVASLIPENHMVIVEERGRKNGLSFKLRR